MNFLIFGIAIFNFLLLNSIEIVEVIIVRRIWKRHREISRIWAGGITNFPKRFSPWLCHPYTYFNGIYLKTKAFLTFFQHLTVLVGKKPDDIEPRISCPMAQSVWFMGKLKWRLMRRGDRFEFWERFGKSPICGRLRSFNREKKGHGSRGPSVPKTQGNIMKLKDTITYMNRSSISDFPDFSIPKAWYLDFPTR